MTGSQEQSWLVADPEQDTRKKVCVYSRSHDLNFPACPSRSGGQATVWPWVAPLVRVLALPLEGARTPSAEQSGASFLFSATVLDLSHILAMATAQPKAFLDVDGTLDASSLHEKDVLRKLSDL